MFLKYLILTCISWAKWPQALFLINFLKGKKKQKEKLARDTGSDPSQSPPDCAGLLLAWGWRRGGAELTFPHGFISSCHHSLCQWQSRDTSPIWGQEQRQHSQTPTGAITKHELKSSFFNIKSHWNKESSFFYFKQYILREWEIKFEESLPIRKPPFNYNTQEITEWMAGTVIRDWHRRMTGTEIRPLHHKATYHKSLSGRLTIWLYCQLNS